MGSLQEIAYEELCNSNEITINVANPFDSERRVTLDALVSSDRIYNSLPREVLQNKLGIEPVRKDDFLISGVPVQRDIGYALIVYKELNAVVPVVFLEPEDEKLPTLGRIGIACLNPIKLMPSIQGQTS